MAEEMNSEAMKELTKSLGDFQSVLLSSIKTLSSATEAQDDNAKSAKSLADQISATTTKADSLEDAINDTAKALTGNGKALRGNGKTLEQNRKAAKTYFKTLQRGTKTVGEFEDALAEVDVEIKDVKGAFKELTSSTMNAEGAFTSASDTARGFAGGLMSLATASGIQALASNKLVTTTAEYNKTIYDSIRMGNIFGANLKTMTKLIDNVSASTGYSTKAAASMFNAYSSGLTASMPDMENFESMAKSLTKEFGFAASEVDGAMGMIGQMQDIGINIDPKFITDLSNGVVSAEELKAKMADISMHGGSPEMEKFLAKLYDSKGAGEAAAGFRGMNDMMSKFNMKVDEFISNHGVKLERLFTLLFEKAEQLMDAFSGVPTWIIVAGGVVGTMATAFATIVPLTLSALKNMGSMLAVAKKISASNMGKGMSGSISKMGVGAKFSTGALGAGMMGMASSNISSGKGNKAVNYAGSVGGGALTGAMIAGPVGAAVGAAVGLAIAAYSDTKQTKESKEKTRIDDITTKIQIDQESVAELKDKASNEAALGNKEKVRDIEIDIEKTQKKIMKNARSIAGESSKAKKIIADMDKEIKASGDSMVKFGNTIRKAKQKFENMNKIIQSNHDLLKASQEFTLGGGSNAQASAFVKERMAMLQLDIENAKIQESRVRAISKEASVGDTSTLDADISSTKSEASGMTKGSDAHKVKMKELEDLMRQRKAVKDGDLTASKAEVNVAQAATAEKRNAMSSYLKEAIDQKHDLAERSTQADKDMAMASVDAYKSLMGGIGLSVGAIEQALGSIESQSEVVSQKMADQGDIIAKIKDKIANAGSVEGRNQAVAELKEASIKMKSFQKEKIGLIKEELELTKELRTGYLSAVTSQAMAAGTFSKIISTREQSIDKAMKYRDKGNQYDMVYGGLKDTKGSRARGAKGNRMQHGVGGIENADASKDALAEAMEANGETATKDTDRMLKQLNALQGSYDASPKKIGTAIGVQISGTGTAIQNAIMGGGGATLSTVNDSINRAFKAEGGGNSGGGNTGGGNSGGGNSGGGNSGGGNSGGGNSGGGNTGGGTPNSAKNNPAAPPKSPKEKEEAKKLLEEIKRHNVKQEASQGRLNEYSKLQAKAISDGDVKASRMWGGMINAEEKTLASLKNINPANVKLKHSQTGQGKSEKSSSDAFRSSKADLIKMGMEQKKKFGGATGGRDLFKANKKFQAEYMKTKKKEFEAEAVRKFEMKDKRPGDSDEDYQINKDMNDIKRSDYVAKNMRHEKKKGTPKNIKEYMARENFNRRGGASILDSSSEGARAESIEKSKSTDILAVAKNMALDALKGFMEGSKDAEKTAKKAGEKAGKGIMGGKILSDKASIMAGASDSSIKKFGRELKYDKLGIESTQSGISGLNSKQEKIMRDESKEGVPKGKGKGKGGTVVSPGAVSIQFTPSKSEKENKEALDDIAAQVKKGLADVINAEVKSGQVT